MLSSSEKSIRIYLGSPCVGKTTKANQECDYVFDDIAIICHENFSEAYGEEIEAMVKSPHKVIGITTPLIAYQNEVEFLINLLLTAGFSDITVIAMVCNDRSLLRKRNWDRNEDRPCLGLIDLMVKIFKPETWALTGAKLIVENVI